MSGFFHLVRKEISIICSRMLPVLQALNSYAFFKIRTTKHSPCGGEFTMALEVESAFVEYTKILN